MVLSIDIGTATSSSSSQPDPFNRLYPQNCREDAWALDEMEANNFPSLEKQTFCSRNFQCNTLWMEWCKLRTTYERWIGLLFAFSQGIIYSCVWVYAARELYSFSFIIISILNFFVSQVSSTSLRARFIPFLGLRHFATLSLVDFSCQAIIFRVGSRQFPPMERLKYEVGGYTTNYVATTI